MRRYTINRVQRVAQRETQALLGAKHEALFFDATTLYFGVNESDELHKNGWNKDGESRHVQRMVLVQTADGLPIDYELLPGNTADVSTLLSVFKKLQDRFDVSQTTLAVDSEMSNETNIADLRELNCDYLLAAQLDSIGDDKLAELLLELDNQPMDADGFKLLDTEHDGRRLVLSYSPSLAETQRRERTQLIESLVTDGERWGNLNVKAFETEESKLDGVHGIYTSLSTEDYSASAINARHTELWRLEHSFRILKSDLRMRPTFHWQEERIKAHVAICFTAYMLLAHLHYRVNLSAGDLERMSPTAILDHLSGVQVAVVTDNQIGRQLLIPSQTTREQQAIYTAAGAKLVRTTTLRKGSGSGQNLRKV